MSFAPTGLGLTIFNERYAQKKEDGEPETWEEACHRLAYSTSRAEKNGKADTFMDRFFKELHDGYFMPGGRHWYGAGRRIQQLNNCYVAPVADTIEGWGKAMGDVATISARGGGVGLNFSPIRPRGYPIGGMGGTATGAVSLMRVINAVGEEIKDGGGRRAALMFCLNIDHPDVEEFLDAKMKVGDIRNANISVMIPEDMPSEEFVRMVREGEEIPLRFNGLPDREGRTISAKTLFNWLVKNAWDKGEPGLLNWNLVQKMNNISYVRNLVAVNPCFTPDMMLLTEDGYRTFGELFAENRPVRVQTDNRISHDGSDWTIDWKGSKETTVRTATNVYLTQKQAEVVRVITEGMPEVTCTPDHHFATQRGMVEAQDLMMGDKILVALPQVGDSIAGQIPEDSDEVLASLAGLIAGDGTYAVQKQSEQAVVIFWGDDAERMADLYQSKIEALHDDSYHIGDGEYIDGPWKTRTLSPVHRFQTVSDSGVKQIRLSSTWLANALARRFGMTRETKHVVPTAFMTNSRLAKFYIAGLMYADGTINAGETKGSISVRLCQSNKAMLDDIVLALHANGIRGRVVKRRDAGQKMMPDGRGGSAPYSYKEQYEVIISGKSCFRYSAAIGFLGHDGKESKLRLANDRFSTEKEHAWVRVREVVPAGVSDVFCLTEPETHSIIVNGLSTRQCGEQALSPYSNCCLGALVLPRFVVNGKMDWDKLDESVRLAVRYLDDTIDVADYPLPENKTVAHEERRIGLGIMGLHSMLLDLGFGYSSEEGLAFIDKVMAFIKNTAYDTSVNLAIEKGPFPLYDQRFAQTGFAKTLKRGLRNKIKEHGIRNCCLLTIAPTGTTSMVHGVTGGIEPVFSPVYIRRRRVVDEKQRESISETLVVSQEYTDHPELVEGSYDVSPRHHMEVQKVVQKHIDAACSKTVNLPKDYPVEELAELWLEYIPYLKGTTFYREGSRETADSFEPMKHVPVEEMTDTVLEWQIAGRDIEYEDITVADCATGSCDV